MKEGGDETVITKKEFKLRWEADEAGGNITYEDIANCARDWGLYITPRIHKIDRVRYEVLKAAGCIDAEEYASSEEDV